MVVACVLAVVGFACGSQAASVGTPFASEGEKSCVIKHNGMKSQIRPENSGLPCSSIQSILVILSNQPGVTPLYDGNGEPSWICREYPKSALPREVRCHEEERHFEMVRIKKGAGG
jgi:hypothetical protein